jgi:hypothetical protein
MERHDSASKVDFDIPGQSGCRRSGHETTGGASDFTLLDVCFTARHDRNPEFTCNISG